MKFPVKIFFVLFFVLMVSLISISVYSPYRPIGQPSYISPNEGVIRITTTLYFVHDGALRAERHRIPIVEGSYELSVMEALKNGPNNHRYDSIFDLDVDYITIENVNNTCYVNLRGRQISSFIASDGDASLYLWSIVNSLTELKNVFRVQFMIEGQPINIELSGYSLSEPVPRIDTFVYTREVNAEDVVSEFVDYIKGGRFDLAYNLITLDSQERIDYIDFIQYANTILVEINDFNRHSMVSKIYPSQQIVYVRFIGQFHEADLSVSHYLKWYVRRDTSYYRIHIPEI